MKKFLSLLCCALLLITVFTGCADQKTQSDKNTKKFTAAATTGFFGAESLDVAHNWDGWIMSIYGISENLFRLDEEYSPQPWIAESYRRNGEYEWIFKIRDDVFFSDSVKVTAQAVKDCFERTYELNDRAGSVIGVKSIKASGQELTIVTESPAPTLLSDLCDPLFGIYNANGNIDDTLGVSCTGPYKAVEFTPMTEVRMVKNDKYWRNVPKLDEVELKVIDDTNALQMAMQNSEIDMIAQMDARSADLFSDDDRYTVKAVTSSRSDLLMYNFNSPGINDPAVREAIGFCIDRESFAKVVYNSYATANYGVFPDVFTFGGTDGMDISVDRYDPDEAEKILKNAGYADTNGDSVLDKNGVNLEFDVITYSYNTASIQLCDMLESSLSKVGIKLNTLTYDMPEDKLQSGEFDIAVLSYATAPTGTSEYLINMMFKSGSGNNYGGYSDKNVDQLANRLSVEFDSGKRDLLTREICETVINDHAFDFAANQQFICAWRNGVSGVSVNPSEYYLITSDIDVTE